MTQKKTYRISQINRLIQEEIAKILLMEMQDEHIRNVTVTEVRCSRDLSHALAFIATHRNESREEVLEHLNQASGYIRKLIFGRVRIKKTPSIEFRYDESLDHAERIFQALREIQDDLIESDAERLENDPQDIQS